MKKLWKKKQGSGVIENMLTALMGIIMMTAFLVIIFGAFSSISNKWNMRQAAKEYLLVMGFEHSIRNENERR